MHAVTIVAVRPLVDRVQPVIRALLLVCGFLVVIVVLGGGLIGAHQGAGLGPAQRQVGVLGTLLFLAGLFPAPSRRVAELLTAETRRSGDDLKPVTVRCRWQLVAIVALALTFRGVMIRTYWPENQMISGMTLWDAEMARNLLHGRGWVLNWAFVQKLDRAVVERQAMVDPEDFLPADDERPGALAPLSLFAHTPGYSLWLAASFAIGQGLRLAYAQWMQAVLDSFGCLLVFGIGRRLWSNRAGVLGALLYALSPAHVYLAIQTVAAATDSVWALLIAYGMVRLWTDRALRPFPVVGMLCVIAGALCEAAINSLLFTMPLIAAAWTAAIGVFVPPARRLALYLVAAQLAVVVLLTPWALRNKRVYDQFAFTRQQFWEFVWELPLGNVENPWGLAFGNNDAPYEAWIHERCPDCSQPEREALTRRFMFTQVIPSRQFPPLMARAMVKRLPGLVYSSRLPADKPFVPHSAGGQVFSAALRVLNVAALVIWPASLLGLALTTLGTARAPAAWMGLGTTAFLLAFSVVFFVEHRKTAPAYGYMLSLSGVAGAAFLERQRPQRTESTEETVSHRETEQQRKADLLFSVTSLLCVIPFAPYPPLS
jgi:multidrug transporter EmrE-like cation transporter